jgi:hypothetical protein
MKYIFMLIIVLLSISAFSQTDTLPQANLDSTTSRRKVELEKVSDDVKSLDSLLKVKDDFANELKKLNVDKEKNKLEIDKLRSKLQSTESEIKKKQKTLSDVQAKIKEANQAYSSLLSKIKSDSLKLVAQADSIKKQRDSLKAQSDTLKEKNNSASAQLNSILAEIAKKEDSLEAIAIIRLKKNGWIYLPKNVDSNYREDLTEKKLITNIRTSFLNNSIQDFKTEINKKSKTISVDSLKVRVVHIKVKEGRIEEIVVKTDKGIFRNTLSQIDLVHFSERKFSDKLFREDEDRSDLNKSRSYIYPGDVIMYEPIKSFGDIPYSEFEVKLTPDSSGSVFVLRESTSINSYFEVAAFTDIKGIAGDANGLAQITGSAKFITSTRNHPNTTLMFAQYISFTGGLSKFDNDFKGTFINKSDSINRKELFQRSLYNVGVKVNLLRWVRSPYPKLLIQDIQVNAGFSFVGSRVADTVTKSRDTLFRTVTHNQFYIEPIMSFNRQKNFNMTIGLPFYYQNLKASSGIANAKSEWWVCPSINLMYYSKRDSKSKIFFRYNHFINLKDKKQAFTQMQLGFAASLTNVMQGK